jgi:hypothetical protein
MYRLRGMGTTVTDLIAADAAKYGLNPALLLSVAQHESSLNPNAVSPAGAQGVMQLMPATAASLGVSNPLDPAQNIDAGARYLSQLVNQYNGDVSLALAAYNAGPGNVAKYGGIPPFPETQSYVSGIMSDIGDSGAPGSSPADPFSGAPDASGSFQGSDGAGLSTAAMVGLGIAALALAWAVAS